MSLILKTLALTLTYLSVAGAWSLADVLSGVVVGVVVTKLTDGNERTRKSTVRGRLTTLPWFLVGIVRELFQGAWTMLLVLTGLKTWKSIGYVDVPHVDHTPTGASVHALLTSMSPGSLFVDINEQEQTMRFNVIDAQDADKVRAEILDFYNRYQKPTIP